MTDVSKEYGKALYLLAVDEKKEDEYFTHLWAIRDIFKKNPEYLRLLSSPALSAGDKKDLVQKAFSGKTEEYIVSFMKLLCDRGYIAFITECIEYYKEEYYQKKNIKEGVVKSAYPLSDEEKDVITKATAEKIGGGSKVLLSFETDESLIGGFLCEVDGKVIDSTLKTKLLNLGNILADS